MEYIYKMSIPEKKHFFWKYGPHIYFKRFGFFIRHFPYSGDSDRRWSLLYYFGKRGHYLTARHVLRFEAIKRVTPSWTLL